MAAVLNFYPGNEPTSLRYVIEAHRDKGVTSDELNAFKVCFLETLDDRMDKANERRDRKDAIGQAWQDLFDRVLGYFREHRV